MDSFLIYFTKKKKYDNLREKIYKFCRPFSVFGEKIKIMTKILFIDINPENAY